MSARSKGGRHPAAEAMTSTVASTARATTPGLRRGEAVRLHLEVVVHDGEAADAGLLRGRTARRGRLGSEGGRLGSEGGRVGGWSKRVMCTPRRRRSPVQTARWRSPSRSRSSMRPARSRSPLSGVISRMPPRLKPTSRGSTSERRTPASARAFSSVPMVVLIRSRLSANAPRLAPQMRSPSVPQGQVRRDRPLYPVGGRDLEHPERTQHITAHAVRRPPCSPGACLTGDHHMSQEGPGQ